jgi:outer membrane receptor protein involved in Fe transport
MAVISRPWRARLMSGAAFAALTISAGVANAQEARTINIAPQALATALYEFGGQTGHQVMFTPEVTAAKITAGVKVTGDEQVALAELLRGTGLTFRRQDNVFVIIPSEGSPDPQSGSAVGDGADQGTVQALIVTAQKREEHIQDVPIAMSAFTQEDLTKSQVSGGPDLMTQVPNFTFTKTNFSGYSIQIRGIGTQAISATVDPAVAVAFNNTPFIRNRFFEQEFYDLERIEVLRGPQGTLYGRNATAGVVNIISAKPKFSYQARASADVGNYNSTRLEAMVNVPLVDDKVALRIAGAWTKRDGYDTNQVTGNQIDGRDLWSTRLSLRFAPTDKLDVNLIWEHFQEDDDRLRSGKQLCKKDQPDTIAGLPLPHDGGLAGSLSATFTLGCAATSLYGAEAFQTPNGYSLPYFQPLAQLSLPVVYGLDPYLYATQSRDLRTIESSWDPEYKAKTDVVELQISADLGNHLTFTSETGYLGDLVWSIEDYNRFTSTPNAFQQTFDWYRPGIINNGVFCDPQLGCSDRLLLLDLSTAKSRQFSQEFRLASDYDGPFNFSLGANFLRYDTEEKYYVFLNTLSMWSAMGYNADSSLHSPYVSGVSDNLDCMQRSRERGDTMTAYDYHGCIYIDPNPIGSLNDQGHNYFLSRNPYKLISYAAFGEAYYQIDPALKVTAGLRFTIDRKQAPRIPSWLIVSNSYGYPVAGVYEKVWREPTGRVAIDWKPDLAFTDQTLIYASYVHGYKAGGSNPPPAISGDGLPSAVHPGSFDPEFVDAFELGSKNTLLDGRLTLNGNLFHYDYKGYQISQIVDRSAVTLNLDAKIWGAEIEADWRPVENLKFGFKGGFENTRLADGSRAIDVMDRTAGDPNWTVIRPFPIVPSNCIVPTWLVTWGGTLNVPHGDNGEAGPCVYAYQMGLDPVTLQPYVPNPDPSSLRGLAEFYAGYPGFDPKSAPNNGEGIKKDISGNALPNAPHFTATLTVDYTLPLPHDWLMTLHSDLYYQSEAWARVFNTPGYDKLKAYTNVNLAAIFTNEDAGWKVMAYVKNVLDHDSITGAFLNSDDTGLTTNVFLNEPRLYGLRVTKEWSGGPWWTGASPNHVGPYPLTMELAGQVQRQDAPYETLKPGFANAFSSAIDPTALQNRNLDWGDGRAVKLTWQPSGSPWSIWAGLRHGRTNTSADMHHDELAGDKVCMFPVDSPYGSLCDPTNPSYQAVFQRTPLNWSEASTVDREEHSIADFGIGRDVGLGLLESVKSRFGMGFRYADFSSTSHAAMEGVPDLHLPDGWRFKYSTHHRYAASLDADRGFKGAGPILNWTAARWLLGNEEVGHLDVDWSVSAGVLFGKQKTRVDGFEAGSYFNEKYQTAVFGQAGDPVPVKIHRNSSVSAPVLDLSLGLSYDIQRIKVSTGYRWERYFNVLDAGFEEHKSYDRTFDGPYFKIAVGFGG